MCSNKVKVWAMRKVAITYSRDNYTKTISLSAFLHFIGVQCDVVEHTELNSTIHYDVVIDIDSWVDKTLEDIIKAFNKMKLINGDELNDIEECLEIFEKYEYTKVLYMLYYNQKQENIELFNKYYEVYTKIFDELYDKPFSKMGTHRKYAAVLVAYELDFIAKRYRLEQSYIDEQSVLRICKDVVHSTGDMRFELIASLICANVTEDIVSAFNLAINIRNSERDNEFAYYILGDIMFKKSEFKRATEYFRECINLDNTDYRAMYKLGYSLFKLKENKKAYEVFYDIYTMLNNNKQVKNLNNIEIEYLYASIMMLITFDIDRDALSVQKYCMNGLRILQEKEKENEKENEKEKEKESIYSAIGIEKNEIDIITNNLHNSLDTEKLKKHGIESFSKTGLDSEALKFTEI